MKSLIVVIFIIYFVLMIINIIIFNYLNKKYHTYVDMQYENYISNTYVYHVYLYLYQINNIDKKRIVLVIKTAYIIFRFIGFAFVILILYFGIAWLLKGFLH